MSVFSEPNVNNSYLVEHVNRLRNSLRSLTGRDLIETVDDSIEAARLIYYAPFVVVSHDNAADPVFTYGNQVALKLFEMSWQELTALPSRLSAESMHQQERSRLLYQVSTYGFIDNYSGLRISRTGRRFWIEQAIVWNVIVDGTYCGQAATFSQWRFI
jgi:hypothetical protein